jgi:hypothetical protein
MSRPTSTRDLSPSEQRFLQAMTELGYGRLESLRIERGELILDPWPSTVRHVKFSAARSASANDLPAEFELKKQVAEFFEYVRSVETGEIRTLELQHGLPFSMEIGHRSWPFGERRRA